MSRGAPYVGPRALEAGEPFYGRTNEVATLTDRTLAERILLLYSPSGAGKTSLLNAGLLPRLEADYRFGLHTPVRVHLEPEGKVGNRYVFSAIASLEADETGSLGLTEPAIAELSFDEYLKRRRPADGMPHVIVLDQFEELISADPFDRAQKKEFILQLGRALEDRQLYALFAMREEFLGAFDEYRQLLPTRLGAQFRLGLLGHDAASEAIKEPAAHADPPREFTEPAARELLKKLVHSGEDEQEHPFVEPLHLQVICLRIWQQTSDAKQIKKGDIQREGDVGEALAQYYGKEVCRASLLGLDQEVIRAAIQSSVPGPLQSVLPSSWSKTAEERWCGADPEPAPPEVRRLERTIRTWIEDRLISPEGDRRLTQSAPAIDERHHKPVLAHLREAHLITFEPRSAKLWYELSHDRLVSAVRTSNAEWNDRNLNTLQKQAKAWWEAKHKDKDQALPTGEELTRLKQLAAGTELTDHEEQFLEKAEERAKRVRRRNTWAIGTIVALLAIGIFAIFQWRSAVRSGAAARSAELAGEARAVDDPNLSIILAIEASDAESGVGARSALHQASASRLRKALRVDATPTAADLLAASPDGRLVLLTPDGRVLSIDDPMGAIPRADSIPSTGVAIALSAQGSTTAILTDQGVHIVRSDATITASLPAAGIDLTVVGDTVLVVLEDGTLSIHPAAGSPSLVTVDPPVSAIASNGPSRIVVGHVDGSTSTLAADTLMTNELTPARAPVGDDGMDRPVVRIAIGAGTVAATHGDGQLELIDYPSGTIRTTVPLGEPASALELTSSGLVAAASRDGTVRAIDPQSGSEIFTIELSTGLINGLAPLPGDLLAIAAPGVATTIWDVSVGHLPGQTSDIVASSSDTVISGGSDGQLLSWSLGPYGLTAAVPLVERQYEPQAVVDVATRDDGLLAFAIGSRVELSSGAAEPTVLEHDTTVRAIELVPQELDIVSVTDTGVLTRWTDSGRARSTVAIPEFVPIDLVATQSQAFILATDGTLHSWAFSESATRSMNLPTEFAPASSLGWHEGDVLIGTSDGRVLVVDEGRVGDADSERYQVVGPGLAPVTDIAAMRAPDGSIIAFAMADGTIEVWRLQDDETSVLSERMPGRVRVLAVDITPDRKHVVTATIDGRVVAYPLDPEVVDDVALDRLGRNPSERECARFELQRAWCDE